MALDIDRRTYDKSRFCRPGQGYQARDSNDPQPTRIIIHTTNGKAGTTFEAEARFLAQSHDVSAHYIVGKRGQIARILRPQDYIAWHAGRTRLGWDNGPAIGIEVHNTPAEGDFTPLMLDTLGALVLEICEAYPIGNLVESMQTHRYVALPAGRKIDPSGLNDLTFVTWRKSLQCQREKG